MCFMSCVCVRTVHVLFCVVVFYNIMVFQKINKPEWIDKCVTIILNIISMYITGVDIGRYRWNKSSRKGMRQDDAPVNKKRKIQIKKNESHLKNLI